MFGEDYVRHAEGGSPNYRPGSFSEENAAESEERTSSPVERRRAVADVVRERDEEAGHILDDERLHTDSSRSDSIDGGSGGNAAEVGLLHTFWKSNDAKPQRKSRVPLLHLIPYFSVVLLIVLFGWVALSSGQSKVETSSPRAVLIVVEGFSGEVFNGMLQEGNGVHLPNIRRLLAGRGGVWAACPTVTDSRCARAVSVEEEVWVRNSSVEMDSNGVVRSGAQSGQQQERFSVYSATSIASILSGVHPSKHMVVNNTLGSMFEYSKTAKMYPSVAKIVKDAGLQVTVLGTSHLLNSLGSETWSCTRAGVLDMECPDSVAVPEGVDFRAEGAFTTLECMGTSSCNANVRRTKLPTNPREMNNNGVSEEQYRRILKDIFGSTSHEGETATARSTTRASLPPTLSELYIFHFDSLAQRAESPDLPDFSYNISSAEYQAQAYLIDSLIGQILAYVEDKSVQERENWLVLGISDHGGNGKQVNYDADYAQSDAENGTAGPIDTSAAASIPAGLDDTQLSHLLRASVVPFFMGTFTSSNTLRTSVTLKPLERPTSQLDVLPTLLRWLNVAPFDDGTEAAWEALSRGDSVDTSDAFLQRNLALRRQYDGTVQGICSSGVLPLDCVR